MSNTYTQIYIHLIFAVKNRESILIGNIKDKVLRYFNGTINNNEQKLISINAYKNHIHILISLDPNESISSTVRKLKVNSANFIKQNNIVNNFGWQEGYGAFSYSKSQINDVMNYIENQEEHHKIKTFREEYEDFLIKFNVPYNPKYIFKEIE